MHPSIFLIVINHLDYSKAVVTYRPTREEAEKFLNIYNLHRESVLAEIEELLYY